MSLFHVVGGLLSRDQLNTVFDRDAVPGIAQLRRYGIALLAIVLITGLDLLNRIFETTSLDFNMWLVCIGLALTLLVVEEVVKLVLRWRGRGLSAPTPSAPAVVVSA